MFLSELDIEGYKNFGQNTTIYFHKGLNVLVGENVRLSSVHRTPAKTHISH